MNNGTRIRRFNMANFLLKIMYYDSHGWNLIPKYPFSCISEYLAYEGKTKMKLVCQRWNEMSVDVDFDGYFGNYAIA